MIQGKETMILNRYNLGLNENTAVCTYCSLVK